MKVTMGIIRRFCDNRTMNFIGKVILFVFLVLAAIPVFYLVKGYIRAKAILKEKPIDSTVNEIMKKKTSVPFEEISEKCRRVIIGTEDTNFYKHHGTDWKPFWDCMFYNLTTGFWQTETINGFTLRKTKGASTITNQTAKVLFLTQERTVSRKITEFFITRALEKNLTKDQILTLYLNSIDFGDDCIGIGPASIHYFQIPPSELGIGQTASLQAIMKCPAWFHPLKSPEEFRSSRNYGLGSLVINHVISDETRQLLKEREWNLPDDERIVLLEEPAA